MYTDSRYCVILSLPSPEPTLCRLPTPTRTAPAEIDSARRISSAAHDRPPMFAKLGGMMAWVRVGDFTLTWGESARWDDRRQRLYFVDCATPSLHWLDGGEPPLAT